MVLNDFIGKVVVNPPTKKRFVLREITASYINAAAVIPDSGLSFTWDTVNGDPISTGKLVFEDTRLTEPFKEAYSAHCHSEAGYWENYGYWLRRD